MPDLVEKFFKQGLTDAEEAALSEALWASEDLAEKFAGLAQEAYRRYGLPEPQAPDSFRGPSAPPGAGWGPWVEGTVLLLVLGAGLFYWFFHALNPIPFLAGQGSPGQKLAGSQNQNRVAGAPESASSEQQEPTNEETGSSPAIRPVAANPLPPSRAGSAVSINGSPPVSGAWARPASTPINIDQNPKGDYTQLSVMVHLGGLTPLQVRVLDTRGLELLPLFSGSLGPGHWVFQWNGKLAGGTPAPAGFYVIEIKSGAYFQRKTVEIH